MKKITKKIWEENLSSFLNNKNNIISIDTETIRFSEIISTFQKIVPGKIINDIFINSKRCINKLTKESIEKFGNYTESDEFRNKYSLEEAGYYLIDDGSFYGINHKSVVNLEESAENCIVEKKPGLLLGDNIVITLIYSFKKPYIEFIFYTEDSIDVVKQLIGDLKEFYDSLEKVPENIQYKINTVELTPSGLMLSPKYPTTTNIIDINKQFNEDLPIKQINNFLRQDKSGIAIFNGEPGCGKTSFLRYLIIENKDITFSYIPAFTIMSDIDGFRNLICNIGVRSNNKSGAKKEINNVFIIEDCEKLILSRESNGGSPTISDILNFTDGILSDISKIKFILTYNTDTSKIDPALLRKGRLYVKYEFKKLKGDRLINLCNEVNSKIKESNDPDSELININELDEKHGMKLADIFNRKKIEFSEKEGKAIGFKK